MRKAFLFISIAAVFIAGCGSSSSSSLPATPPVANLGTVDFELVHASQDAPPVNLSVGGTVIASGADFLDAAFVTTTGGEITVNVEGIIPGGNADVITETATFTDGQRVTVFAANDVANIEPIILIDDQPDVAATDVRVRIVHAASNVTPITDMVDIYVTAPGDPIAAATPFTLMFGGSTVAVTVPAGDYRIRITPASSSTVVYDSGTVALAGGSDLVVAALANVGPGDSPVELIALTGSASLRLIDENTPADLRVGHISADAGTVDVLANDGLPPAVPSLEYGVVTGYLPLPAGPINFKVTEEGIPANVAIDTLDEVSLDAGVTYSVFAVGLAGDMSLTYQVAVDNPRRVTTESRVRIFHGSPAAGSVDIYVVGTGEAIDGLTPNFTAVEFGADTGYVPLAPGSYDVVVTPTGDTLPAIPRTPITVAGGGIYTAIAADAIGGGAPVGLILADDFL